MSKEDWKSNSLKEMFNLKPVSSVLDVGCGLSLKSKYLDADIRVGIDIYPEYFKHIESDVPYVVLKGDVRKLLDIFIPKSFDIVIATDIVEHLEREEALRLIDACELIAKKAVIIETPLGYVPQNIDILGYGGHKYQTHRSGWEERDFSDRGYTVKVREYKMQDVKRHTKYQVPVDIQLIDAIKYV